jgi:hypothetical protein
MTGNIAMSGAQTVDGRDLSADGTKLDAIEASATADQTNAEIVAAVEAGSDSNTFTNADHTKLNAIEASATADQTNAEIVAAVEAGSNSNTFTDADHTKLNALDVADVGYHTVTVVGATSGSYTMNTAADSLRYFKTGEMVHVQGVININGKSSPVGQIRISLPFVISDLTDASEQIYGPTRLDGHGDAGIEQPFLLATPGASYLLLANHTDAGAYEAIDQTRVDTNWYVSVNLTYIST